MKKIILSGLFMVLFISFASGSYYDNPLINGNAHYYNLDTAGSCIDSADSLDGTLRGSSVHEDNCLINGCYNLTLSGSIDDGIMFENASDDLYALSLWFQGSISTAVSGTSIGLRNSSILGGGTMYLHHGDLSGGATSETLMIYNELAGTQGVYIRDVESFGWHHLIMNWNGTGYQIWLDGTKRTTYPLSFGNLPLIDWYQLRIGTDGTVSDWEGAIDEISTWNRSLSDDEIIYLYNDRLGNQYPYSLLIYPTNGESFQGTYNGSIIIETIENTSICYLDSADWSLQGSQNSDIFHWLNTYLVLGNQSLQYSCSPHEDFDRNTAIDIHSTNEGTVSGYTFNDGTVTSATHTTDGYYGSAYEFDGVNDYVFINNVDDFNNEGTIHFKMKANSIKDGARIFLNNEDLTPSIASYIAGTNYRIYARNSGGVSDYFDFPVIINTWYDVSIIYNSTNVLVYINGNLNDTFSHGGLFTDTEDVYLAVYGTALNNYFNGSIDEVRIWNTSLTQTQIQEEMNSPNPVNTEGLISSYSFESWGVSGATAYDTNIISQGHESTIESQAYNFDGVDDYIISNNNLFNNNSGTLSYWIKHNDAGVDYSFCFWQNANNRLCAYNSGGTYYHDYYDGASSRIGFLNPTTWTYITLIWENNNMSNYVNGVYVNSISPNFNSFIPTSFQLGTYDSGNYNWYGSISDVQIFDRALSEDEILELYNNWTYTPYDSIGEDLVSYYPLNAIDTYGNWTTSDFWFYPMSLFQINIYDEQSNDVITDDISFIFRSDTYEFKETASGGSYSLTNITQIPPGFYQIILNGTDYYPRTYYLTIENLSYQTSNFYLLDTNSSSLVTFKIKDLSDNFLDNISVIFTTWINITDSEAPISHRYTDFSGSILVNLHYLTRYGITLTDSSRVYAPKYAEIEPVFSSYTIYLDKNSSQNFTTVWDHISYIVGVQNLTLNPSETNFTFQTVSDNGNIDYYGIYATINGTYYVTNITTHPSGGTAYLSLPLNASNNQNVQINYFIRTTNPHDVLLPITYSILNISSWGGNYSLSKIAPSYKSEFSERFRMLSAHFIAILVMALFGVFIRRNYAPLVGIPVLIAFAIPPISWIPVWIVIFESIIILGFFTAFGDW